MYRRAQNILEISMLACMVIIIGVAVVTLYNNQKMNLVNMSRISSTVDVVPNDDPDTGGVSGSVVVGPGNGEPGPGIKPGPETVGTVNSTAKGSDSNIFSVIDNLLK